MTAILVQVAILHVTVILAAVSKSISLEGVPNICQKESFRDSHVRKGKLLSAKYFEQLKNCGKYYPGCTQDVGTLSATYAKWNVKSKLVIFIDAMEIEKQGCWGYVLQLTDDTESRSIYFNFDEEDKDFKQMFPCHLTFKYNFTVTPLPSGSSLSIITQAPTRCELEVIEYIYYRLVKEKTLFAECESSPGFTERKNIATKICQKYPQKNRKNATHKLLIEKDCQFALLSSEENQSKQLLRNIT